MTTTTEAAEPEVNSAGFTHKQILAIMSGLMMGMLLAALDQTIVSTSIRTIADELHGYSAQAWVTTAYLITSTLATPLYGKLSDMYGRKPFYLAAISIFVVGSLACSMATSMYELAAFRAFQGLGAGGLMSLALTIMGDIVSPRERARYQGYFLAVFGTSSVVGPVVGGLLSGTDQILGVTGWRWVFLVNVPVGIIALAVVTRVLRLPKRPVTKVPIDWMGISALIVGLVPLLVVAEQGREWGWTSGHSLLCYILGAVGILSFIAVEAKQGDAALIPLRMFKNSTFALGVVISVVVGAAMFGGITLLPQYLQVVQGASPTKAGLLMLPLVAGMMTGSILAGQLISKTGRYKYFPPVGAALLTSGLFLLHLVSADTKLWVVMIFMAITGFGLGNLMQPLTLALQNALPPKDMGVSTAAATFFRQIGGTLGVAVFLSVLFTQLAPNITTSLEGVRNDPAYMQAAQEAVKGPDSVDKKVVLGLSNPQTAPAVVSQVLSDSSVVQQLNPTLAHPFKEGFADSMDRVFLSATVVSLIGFILVLFWKEVPLRTAGGIQARKEAAEEAA
ncbi:MFS transporter [Nocardia seriolae]|uniref:MFS transporter n=2 Tax=Nocardia seriolae TaxID=37332 RepID=A0A0B8NE47_9NOCA|nr:MDR family MFS transporter [Nocardia seriolae]APA96184.1 Multidrug resistance protein [Nocardia seriolae]MTJ65740.1 DHA2 family efflux MFS transporter permease subunit [Nocardia seriolae]MTJ71610.1 DHA2 family efflux MFS transporter permease subunit [Nocardia seriolae]MTJ86327.1 DHA2 family efflux MFS transporter permease subunit [Nocardia seriolae]MTK30321.1 DHA2 family efflux MFS transporter permease subunit [Nocardia seriolae]